MFKLLLSCDSEGCSQAVSVEIHDICSGREKASAEAAAVSNARALRWEVSRSRTVCPDCLECEDLDLDPDPPAFLRVGGAPAGML